MSCTLTFVVTLRSLVSLANVDYGPSWREYYAKVSAIINEETINNESGTLDKFMGDGVLALFGNFEDLEEFDVDQMAIAREIQDRTKMGEKEISPEHRDLLQKINERNTKIHRSLESAVEAGMRIAEHFKLIRRSWLNLWRSERPLIRKKHRFEIGVAIHTGAPIVGLFGSTNPDHYAALSYTAIGNDINLVTRIGDEAENNTVWISGTSWQYLRRSSRFGVVGKPKELKPEGFSEPIEAFRVRRKLP